MTDRFDTSPRPVEKGGSDRQVMQQALEALEQLQGLCSEEDGFIEQVTIWTPEAIDALRERLAQQEQPDLLRDAYERANPLGGPARIFDAMADSIRAGDDYHQTLARFGYAELHGDCDMGELCIGCIPRRPDGSCPSAPQPAVREWVGLTQKELQAIYNAHEWNSADVWGYERAIEAKLREKNGGGQ